MTGDFAEINQRLAARVLTLRKAADLTQAGLAEKADMTETYVYLIENARCNPSLKKMCALANALSIDLIDLIKA